MERDGGNLYLRGTQITSLPDNLTVGGWLDLSGTQITTSERRKVKSLQDGDYVAGRYLYCDGILTHVSKKRRVGEYTLYVGKIKNRNVVSDGKLYAHCETLRDGIADIAFKRRLSVVRVSIRVFRLTRKSRLRMRKPCIALSQARAEPGRNSLHKALETNCRKPTPCAR